MAQLAIPLMLAGTAVSAAGQYQEGQATAAGLKSQADAARAQAAMEQKILNQNAEIERRIGDAKLESGLAEASDFAKEADAIKGRASVLQKKSGTYGPTANLTFEDLSNELNIDRMRIIDNAYKEQAYHLSTANNIEYQGRASIAQGENIAAGLNYQAKGAKRGATYGALGTLLTGFGNAYSMKA